MLVYAIEATIVWSLLYGVYHFILRGDTYFQWNRIYLIGALGLGLLIPFIHWEPSSPILIEPIQTEIYLEPIIVGLEGVNQQTLEAESGKTRFLTLGAILISIYFLGLLFFLTRLFLGYLNVIRVMFQGKRTKRFQYTLVEHPSVQSPYSFFHFLFISNKADFNEWEFKSIEQHECIHIKEGHSLDTLFVNLLQAIFWWCPILPFYRKAIRLTHEYIADQYVLRHIRPVEYGRLLLRQTLSGKVPVVTNHFSLQLKKRFVMMKKERSKPFHRLKYLLSIPVIGLLFVTMAVEIPALAENSMVSDVTSLVTQDTSRLNSLKELSYIVSSVETVDQVPMFPGCESLDQDNPITCSNKQMIMYMYKNIRYPRLARESGVEGRVIVGFTVTKTGDLENIGIVESLDDELDAEVLSLIEEMPNWIPAMKGGAPVEINVQVPVNFTLEGSQKNSNSQALPFELTVVGYKPDPVFKKVDVMPVFAGCDEATSGDSEALKNCSNNQLLQFVYQNIRYPEAAVQAKIWGMVAVKFVVEKDGSVSNVEIIREIGGACGAEVKRIVELMPQWSPGVFEGKTVRTEMVLPVKFKLDPEQVIDENTNLGLARELILEDFTVGPNPTSSLLNVSFKTTAGDLSLKLTNLSGQVVWEQSYPTFEGSFQQELNIGDLANGTYFLRLEQGLKKFNYKIVKN